MKRIGNSGKSAKAWILAVIMILTLAIPAAGSLANDPVTDKDCKLTVTISQDMDYEDVTAATVSGKIYKVAEIDEDAAFTTVEAFNGLDVSQVEKASELAALSAQAAEIVKTAEEAGSPIEAAAEFTQDQEITTLRKGLYLVVAEDLTTEQYVYTFTPYLLSLPTAEPAADGVSFGGWNYHVVTTLKAERTDRYGDLEITKTIDRFADNLKETTVVFEVTAEMETVDPETQEKTTQVIYSDVVSQVFTGPGTKTLKIKDFPAGAKVTVTELYSGASYTLTASDAETQTIVADEVVGVSFTNTWNRKLHSDTSIDNYYEKAGEHGWYPVKQQTDSGETISTGLKAKEVERDKEKETEKEEQNGQVE